MSNLILLSSSSQSQSSLLFAPLLLLLNTKDGCALASTEGERGESLSLCSVEFSLMSIEGNPWAAAVQLIEAVGAIKIRRMVMRWCPLSFSRQFFSDNFCSLGAPFFVSWSFLSFFWFVLFHDHFNSVSVLSYHLFPLCARAISSAKIESIADESI